MTKVLITGSDSFVGKNFRVYSRFSDSEEISLLENKPEEIEFGRFDVVLHLAAIVHQSKNTPESEYFRVNRDLCLRVAEQSKKSGIKHFIFLSTIKVYGDKSNGFGLRNESSECYPDDSYGKSKFEAEIGLKKLEDANFTVSIIRTPLIYGEGVKANMISLVKLVDLFPFLPFGKIDNRRNFTYVENLVAYIDQILMKRASGVFIIMDGKSYSTTELINYIASSLEKKVILFKLPRIFLKLGYLFVPDTLDRIFSSMEFENGKTRRALDFEPPFTTEYGVKKMVTFYINEKHRTRHIKLI
jgi:nucleoside-diphosphate-sugar epimerase